MKNRENADGKVWKSHLLFCKDMVKYRQEIPSLSERKMIYEQLRDPQNPRRYRVVPP